MYALAVMLYNREMHVARRNSRDAIRRTYRVTLRTGAPFA